MKNQIDLDTLLTSERKKSGNPDNESVHSIRPCFNAKRQRQLPATRIPINMLRKNDKCSATDATYPLLEAGTSLHNCLAKVAPWIHGAVFDERLADEDIEEEFAELIFITRKIEDLERQIAGVVKARTGRLEAFHV